MGSSAHLRVSGFDIWCLNDGAHVFDRKVFPAVASAEAAERLAASGQTQIDTVFQAFLIKPQGRGYILMDTGCGNHFGDGAGHLVARLAELGVEPADIETLIFSHLHSDHCGGAVNDEGPVFPNATVYMHHDEPGVWAGQTFAANTVLDVYGDRIKTVVDAQEIVPGIHAWSLPGHTAGHMGLRIGGDVVLCVDILHSDALQLPDPTVATVYDDDPDMARQTRLAALQEIADNHLIFAGSHGCHFAKFRRLRVDGAGFVGVDL